MRKVMWLGFIIKMISLILILLLALLGKPIPDILTGIFTMGMLISIIFSFFVRRENNKYNLMKSQGRI